MTLVRDKDKQEIVSREKKDRRDFEQIAALASQMSLHRYIPYFHVSQDYDFVHNVLFTRECLTRLFLQLFIC